MSNFTREMAGDLGRKYPREYKSWQMMRSRCNNKKYTSYEYYGGRGIEVCPRWMEPNTGFRNFIEDMGPRPDKYTLDRIDPEGHYCPENCRWSDKTTQSYNRRPMKHSTRITGITKISRRGKNGFMGHIGNNGKHQQKTFRNLYDAVLWRAEKEREIYGLGHMQREKIIVLINNSFLKKLGYSVDKKEIEEVIR